MVVVVLWSSSAAAEPKLEEDDVQFACDHGLRLAVDMDYVQPVVDNRIVALAIDKDSTDMVARPAQKANSSKLNINS